MDSMNNLSQLKWVSVLSSTEPEIFELRNGENQLMSLSINHTDQTVKIECDGSRRYFHIEKEGLLFNKIIFKNEYGIKIGEIAHELWFNKEGFIELNEEHFHYSIQNDPSTQFTIYGRSKKKTPLLICGLDINDDKNSLHLSKPEEKNKEIYSCLLVALCWFLFTPIAKENIEPVSMNA
jgi:hypothetical protein